MKGLRGTFRAFWDGNTGSGIAVLLTVLTTPLSWLFALGVAARERRYTRRLPAPTPIPVISVGNLSVGGTGKTPLAAWVVALLVKESRRPCLVARGYGQDELALHRRWNPEAGLDADPDRTAAVARAASVGHDVVVLDDGFQHRAVGRALDLVLVSAEEGVPGHLLPRGPFREPLSALQRARGVIITRKSVPARDAEALEASLRRRFPHLVTARVCFVAGEWQALDGAVASSPRSPLTAACSIARPETFRELVRARVGEDVPMVVFPDHHDFRPSDLDALAGRALGGTLIVTEKDAVKLMGALAPGVDARVLPLETVFESGEAEIATLVLEAAGAPGAERS